MSIFKHPSRVKTLNHSIDEHVFNTPHGMVCTFVDAKVEVTHVGILLTKHLTTQQLDDIVGVLMQDEDVSIPIDVEP